MPVRKCKSTPSALFQFLKDAASLAAYSLAVIITGNASLAAALHSTI